MALKRIIILLSPLLLFFILYIPYRYFNSEFLVDWLGCGCPQVDVETGEIIENNFNANTFTNYFWLFISFCVMIISAFLTKLLPKNKIWFKVLYIVLMFGTSLFIAYKFTQILMWE